MTHKTFPNKPLTIFGSQLPEHELLASQIEQLGAAGGELAILEAGCGNHWPIELHGIRYTLTGVDLNADALKIRQDKHGDLDRVVLGDLRTVELPSERFDVIFNSFVLEHVAGAEQVLDNFYRWLRPGGILILRIPDPRSVYGLLSKVTPFWFHVFYKRYIAGMKMAGKPGYDPFPTVYDPIVSREGIQNWSAARGMKVREEVGWNYPIGRPGPISWCVSATFKAFSWLSLGRVTADYVNLSYVIEKPTVPSVVNSDHSNAIPVGVTS